MEISLGVTSSDKRKLDKNVSYALTLSGTLRNETNVVNPTILVEANISILAGCNYMSIPAFHRQYFITDIRVISDDLCEVSGHCDVLSTYASGIRSNTAIIARTATNGNWNYYLDDKEIKLNSRKIVQVKNFPVEFPKDRFSTILVTVG